MRWTSDRAREALRLRLAGDDYGAIATRLGYASDRAARASVEYVADEQDILRLRELGRRRQRSCSCGGCLRCVRREIGAARRRGDVDAYRAWSRMSRHLERQRRSNRQDVTAAYESDLRAAARTCPICRTSLADAVNRPNSKHLDHIVPLNVGGTHTIGNVRILCRDCNIRRPRDGSDYFGPTTLWANATGDVWPTESIVDRTERVAELRRSGRSLSEIIEATGYSRGVVLGALGRLRAQPDERTCPTCGMTFVATISWRRYCSAACQQEATRSYPARDCATCGTSFVPKRRHDQIYCCMDCYRDARRRGVAGPHITPKREQDPYAR